jgi:hypothetical protein
VFEFDEPDRLTRILRVPRRKHTTSSEPKIGRAAGGDADSQFHGTDGLENVGATRRATQPHADWLAFGDPSSIDLERTQNRYSRFRDEAAAVERCAEAFGARILRA